MSFKYREVDKGWKCSYGCKKRMDMDRDWEKAAGDLENRRRETFLEILLLLSLTPKNTPQAPKNPTYHKIAHPKLPPITRTPFFSSPSFPSNNPKCAINSLKSIANRLT
jgi:hypothetical protein